MECLTSKYAAMKLLSFYIHIKNIASMILRNGSASLAAQSIMILFTLWTFYEIDTKPGPHGGISLIDRRPNSHTAYLKPIEIEWLRRKYNEAETEEDRMAAHSILRRFSL